MLMKTFGVNQKRNLHKISEMSGLLKSGIKMIYKSNSMEAVTSLSAGNDIVIMAMQEISPAFSQEKVVSTSTLKRTPTSVAT